MKIIKKFRKLLLVAVFLLIFNFSNAYADQVGKALGVGSFGIVALNPDDPSRDSVIKYYIESNCSSFQRETSVLKKLNHPNIVKFIRSGTSPEGDCLIMVMEYAGRLNLYQYCKKAHYISDDKILFIAKKILCALEYMHGKGFVHGDLKPENIMMTRDGDIKIIDFGSAYKIGERYQSLSPVGTYVYMPLEAFSQNASPTIDMWSVGCILYELCSNGRQLIVASKKIELEKYSPDYWMDYGNVYRAIINYNDQEIPNEIKVRSEKIQELFRGLIVKDASRRFSASEALAVIDCGIVQGAPRESQAS